MRQLFQRGTLCIKAEGWAVGVLVQCLDIVATIKRLAVWETG
jgi:hypothetical protein